MSTVSRLLVGLVALIHFGIAAGELFLWTSPVLAGVRQGLSIERQSEVDKVTPLVTTAGLYNAFVAAGLVWGLVRKERPARLTAFFLGFVALAGLYGSFTLSWVMIVLQTIPAVLALGLLWADGQLSADGEEPPAAEDAAAGDPETVVEGLGPVGEEQQPEPADEGGEPASGLFIVPDELEEPSPVAAAPAVTTPAAAAPAAAAPVGVSAGPTAGGPEPVTAAGPVPGPEPVAPAAGPPESPAK